MIRLILDSLHLVEADTENLKIAKGKYKLPTTLKEGYEALKQEIRWQ